MTLRRHLTATFAIALLVATALLVAPHTATAKDLLSEIGFAAHVRAAILKSRPTAKVGAFTDGAMKITFEDGTSATMFTENAYKAYTQNPEDHDSIIKRHVTVTLGLTQASEKIDIKNVMPVIRHDAYVSFALAQMKKSPPKDGSPIGIPGERLNAELWMVFVEDRPDSTRLIDASAAAELKLDVNGLKSSALANLKQKLGALEVYGQPGSNIFLRLDGYYESSLMLIEGLWKAGVFPVEGETVVFIPTRDTLIITGTGNKEQYAKAQALATKSAASGHHAISDKPFIYRDGTWIIRR